MESGDTKAARSCGPGICPGGSNARRLGDLLMDLLESLVSAGFGMQRLEFHKKAKDDQRVANIKFPQYSQYFVITANRI